MVRLVLSFLYSLTIVPQFVTKYEAYYISILKDVLGHSKKQRFSTGRVLFISEKIPTMQILYALEINICICNRLLSPFVIFYNHMYCINIFIS